MDTSQLANDLQSHKLNLLEEAQALQALEPRRRSKHGVTLGEIAHQIGRSYEWVNRRLILLRLPKEVQQAAGIGLFTATDLEVVASIPRNKQKCASLRILREKELGKQARAEDLTCRTTRQSAKQIKCLLRYLSNQGVEGLPVRLLAWCLGRVDNKQIHREIKESLLLGDDDDNSEDVSISG